MFRGFLSNCQQEREGFFEGVHCHGASEPMSTNFDNIYDLSTEQLEMLDDAEEKMLRNDLGAAEKLLLSMLKSDEECIPVLANLGHLYGRHLSEFETAIASLKIFFLCVKFFPFSLNLFEDWGNKPT